MANQEKIDKAYLCSNKVHLPHNKQMQTDAAKAAPLI